jgi:hypothetical protein
MATKARVALGFTVRTGRAIVVAVGGRAELPEVLAKTRIDVATTFEEGAVFHTAQTLPIEKARALVTRSEATFIERAQRGLAAFLGALGAGEVKLVGAHLVAKPEKQLPPIEAIVKAHPLLHAAEGELYRRVFIAAAAALGPRPSRVAPDALAREAAAAAGLTPAKLAAHLAVMGKAAGKPWAADQKQAALAAWLALSSSQRHD